MPVQFGKAKEAIGVFGDVTAELTSLLGTHKMYPGSVALLCFSLFVVAHVRVQHPPDGFLFRREALGGGGWLLGVTWAIKI